MRKISIAEAKIMIRNGIEVQRFIFSNDKIVYVNTETGDVKPDSTPNSYVDIIDKYNASHNTYSEADNELDRQSVIDRSKDKRSLSDNPKTQLAIGNIRSFGKYSIFYGIFLYAFLTFVLFTTSGINSSQLVWYGFFIIMGGTHLVLGVYLKNLKFKPVGIFLSILFCMVTEGIIIAASKDYRSGLLNYLAFLFAITALSSVNRYKKWYYKEIE